MTASKSADSTHSGETNFFCCVLLIMLNLKRKRSIKVCGFHLRAFVTSSQLNSSEKIYLYFKIFDQYIS